MPAVAMKPGSRGQEIVTLHRRLEISGDLVGMSIPDEYDAAVVAAVKRFQARHGLPPTGVIDSKATVAALNVPASVRLAQLAGQPEAAAEARAERTANRYVLVNIPAAQVEAVEGGRVVAAPCRRRRQDRSGRRRSSPARSKKSTSIPIGTCRAASSTRIWCRRAASSPGAAKTCSPPTTWRPSTRQAIRVDPRQIDWFGEAVYTYNFRQLPWEENSLGFVKINFPNKDAVYLHDTPLKSLFGKPVRFESSGCVRVHNVAELVAWLLQRQSRLEPSAHQDDEADGRADQRAGQAPDPRSTSPISAPGQRRTDRSISGPTSTMRTAGAYASASDFWEHVQHVQKEGHPVRAGWPSCVRRAGRSSLRRPSP